MRFREALQVRLQERYRRLYKSTMDSFDPNVRYFLQWANSVPALVAVLEAVARAEPELDPAAWWDRPRHGRDVVWPESEVGRAKVVLHALQCIASGSQQGHGVAWQISGERNADDAIREFVSDAVEPLVEYLQERLAAESDMLYLLERYRRRVLWFEQQPLWEEYEAATARGEALYDADLRRFLFEQGVDYPYSQPASPSGRADVIAKAETDDPLACEVKLFDGDSYGPAYLAKGLQQAVRYAEDYGHTTAYLVVFNLSVRLLDLPSDDPDAGWPPRLNVAGTTVFLVVVQARPRAAASASGPPKPVIVSRDQLIHPDPPDNARALDPKV